MSSWSAPTCTSGLDATVELPGSKSITNRALVLAALADGPSTVRGTLRSRDTNLMLGALEALGVEVRVDPASDTTVSLAPGPLHGAEIDCGLAGTVMRFLPPLAALADGRVRFDGDPRARVRPQTTILDALRALGVAVTGDRLPFVIDGTGNGAAARSPSTPPGRRSSSPACCCRRHGSTRGSWSGTRDRPFRRRRTST